jgi:hypothetical protein
VEERDAISAEEREAVRSDEDEVEGHALSVDDKGAFPSGDDEERSAFPAGD